MKLPLWVTAIFIPTTAFAHVGYVVKAEEAHQNFGIDFPYLLEPLHHSGNLALMLGTIILCSALYFFLSRKNTNPKFKKAVQHLIQKAKTYENLTPWIMRLSLGIALIGAGTTATLISPLLGNFPEFSLLQNITGFLLLTGFLLTPATLLAMALFIIALSKNIYLLGGLDFLALAIALLISADPKPGIDDLIGIPFASPLKKLRPWIPFILRIGIGGSMIFLALYEKILNPHFSALVVKAYHLNQIIPVSTQMWVLSVGLIELALGFAIVIGFKTRLFAIIAFMVLTVTFFFFKEAVHPHVTLFGTLSLLIIVTQNKEYHQRYLEKHGKSSSRL